jgi:chromate transporter
VNKKPQSQLISPRSRLELFFVFTLLTLQGFGGVISVAQRHLVDKKRWLSNAEFLEMFSLSQVLPGPNVCNLALMIGDRYFGWSGAVSALLGMLLLPFFVILVVAIGFGFLESSPLLTGAVKGMTLVAVGMTLGTATRLASGVDFRLLGWPIPLLLMIGVIISVGVLRIPIVWVVMVCGSISLVWAWTRITAEGAQR